MSAEKAGEITAVLTGMLAFFFGLVAIGSFSVGDLEVAQPSAWLATVSLAVCLLVRWKFGWIKWR